MIGITFTGIDERSDLAEVRRRLLCHPAVEIGILATETPEDRPRYPRLGWITEAVRYLGPRCAVHFCGSRIRARLIDTLSLDEWFGHQGARRIQVNGSLSTAVMEVICNRCWRIPVITQHTDENADLSWANVGPNHQLLVDGSGGRGLRPSEWSAPMINKVIGFAGGLGPLTLATELPRILDVARPGAWIDMESGIRDHADRFDINFAECALDIFAAKVPA